MDETPTLVAWAVRIRRRFLDTVVKPSSSGTERSMVVEDDEATPRGSVDGASSRVAAGVAPALGDVVIAETEMDG